MSPSEEPDEQACALCHRVARLQKSHIVPHFVVRYALKSSPGLLRTVETPNRRVQDFSKIRLLCGDCEQLFSVWEKAFAEQVFTPYHEKDPTKFTTHAYGDWCMKFAASVVWRVVQFLRHRGGSFTQLCDAQRDALRDAEETWRRFLLSDTPHPGRHELHVIPFSLASHLPELEGGVSRFMNRYLFRGHDMDVAAKDGLSFVYVKLMRLVLLGFIEAPNPSHWTGGKLRVRRGSIGRRSYGIRGEFYQYLSSRADACAAAFAALSPRQRKLTQKRIDENQADFAASETFLAMVADAQHFGVDAVTWDGE